eukprot:TRINITY_DN6391_c0_g1_i1.p1 TRINITY_DN6391_c0_g1~~TRINITY_DN6391_c0_g1_i1.p1  ORF type:complete len:548 (+),score=115.48 TRINITY_DN6391_c0_g1_i1:11-1654(+)
MEATMVSSVCGVSQSLHGRELTTESDSNHNRQSSPHNSDFSVLGPLRSQLHQLQQEYDFLTRKQHLQQILGYPTTLPLHSTLHLQHKDVLPPPALHSDSQFTAQQQNESPTTVSSGSDMHNRPNFTQLVPSAYQQNDYVDAVVMWPHSNVAGLASHYQRPLAEQRTRPTTTNTLELVASALTTQTLSLPSLETNNSLYTPSPITTSIYTPTTFSPTTTYDDDATPPTVPQTPEPTTDSVPLDTSFVDAFTEEHCSTEHMHVQTTTPPQPTTHDNSPQAQVVALDSSREGSDYYSKVVTPSLGNTGAPSSSVSGLTGTDLPTIVPLKHSTQKPVNRRPSYLLLSPPSSPSPLALPSSSIPVQPLPPPSPPKLPTSAVVRPKVIVEGDKPVAQAETDRPQHPPSSFHPVLPLTPSASPSFALLSTPTSAPTSTLLPTPRLSFVLSVPSNTPCASTTSSILKLNTTETTETTETPATPATSATLATPAIPATPATPAAIPDMECVVCLDARRDTLLMPCRHFVLCAECGDTVASCPMCRETVTARMKIFT